MIFQCKIVPLYCQTSLNHHSECVLFARDSLVCTKISRICSIISLSNILQQNIHRSTLLYICDLFIYMYIYKYTYTYRYMYIYIYIYVNMYLCVTLHVYICMYIPILQYNITIKNFCNKKIYRSTFARDHPHLEYVLFPHDSPQIHRALPLVCCSVLQCVAVWCCAVCCSVLQCVAVCCSVLFCSVL